MNEPPKLLEYTGVIHIHTTDSDGSNTHEQIIELAQKYHIDFLMFSDHMTLAHKEIENWHDRTLVIVGYEHEDTEGLNHYLVFGLNKPLAGDLNPMQYVHRTRRAGGLGIIAHPDEKREFPEYPPLPWTEWSVREFDGLEIWNHMSSWLEGIASGSKLKYLLNPRSVLVSPPRETLEKWDRLAMRRRILAIASADAHGHRQRILGPIYRTIFPYNVELRALRTHILLKKPFSHDFAQAKKQLFGALRSCRAFMSNYRWGDATGFRFWAQTPQMYAIIGDHIVVNSKLRFMVKAPDKAKIRLIQNCNVIAETEGEQAEFAVKNIGAYRVELWKKGKGWIFSNHIYIVPPEKQFRTQGKYRSRHAKRDNHEKTSKTVKHRERHGGKTKGNR